MPVLLAWRLVRREARVCYPGATRPLPQRGTRRPPRERPAAAGAAGSLVAACTPSSGRSSRLCSPWEPTGTSRSLASPALRDAARHGGAESGGAGVCPAPCLGYRVSSVGRQRLSCSAGPGRGELAARLPRRHGTGEFAAPSAPGGAGQPRPATAGAAKRYRGAGSPCLIRSGRGQGGRRGEGDLAGGSGVLAVTGGSGGQGPSVTSNPQPVGGTGRGSAARAARLVHLRDTEGGRGFAGAAAEVPAGLRPPLCSVSR